MANNRYRLAELNQLPGPEFIDLLGGIYEHSPWVAEHALDKRPFESLAALRDCLFDIVSSADHGQRLQLIRNHPELAGREAARGTLTADSRREQSRAGLDQCSAEELSRLKDLNRRYRDKFGFPFVVAVSGLDRYQVIDAMRARIQNDRDTEFATSIAEIGKIARIRLDALIDE